MADAKDTKWQVYRPEWYNERILETYISSPIIDKQNDKIGTDTIKEAMDFYMKYGVYSYKHEEMPVGLPLAYKVKDGKIKIRVGIHSKLPMHTRVWDEMKIYGDKGGSSIRGEAEKQEKVCEGDVCHNNISELSLWSVSWVGNRPANPEATVTAVAAAKAEEPVKVTKQVTLDEIEGMVEKIIARRGKKYCLFAKKDRKLLGCHSTRAGAVNQERAIQARRFSKMNEDLDDIIKKYVRKKKPCEAGYEMIGTKMLRGKKVPNCVPLGKADYQGRKVELNKPFRLKGENKKFGVYAKNEKGNTVQVKFGDPKMDIKRDSPDKRRNFRSRHNCDNPGPKHKARYWSCKMWSTTSVSNILGKIDKHIWDIAGIRKCKVKKGIAMIKAPKKKPQDYRSGGRTPKGKKPRRDPPSKTQWDNCVQNAKNLKDYYGRPLTSTPERFCGALWYDYQKFGHKDSGSDRAPKPPKQHGPRAGGKEPGNVKDGSGYKFRTRMFDTSNYRPTTLNRRNIATEMSGKK